VCIDGAEVNEIAKQNKTAVFAPAAKRDDAPRRAGWLFASPLVRLWKVPADRYRAFKQGQRAFCSKCCELAISLV
jgi:hypothetical protein